MVVVDSPVVGSTGTVTVVDATVVGVASVVVTSVVGAGSVVVVDSPVVGSAGTVTVVDATVVGVASDVVSVVVVSVAGVGSVVDVVSDVVEVSSLTPAVFVADAPPVVVVSVTVVVSAVVAGVVVFTGPSTVWLPSLMSLCSAILLPPSFGASLPPRSTSVEVNSSKATAAATCSPSSRPSTVIRTSTLPFSAGAWNVSVPVPIVRPSVYGAASPRRSFNSAVRV